MNEHDDLPWPKRMLRMCWFVGAYSAFAHALVGQEQSMWLALGAWTLHRLANILDKYAARDAANLRLRFKRSAAVESPAAAPALIEYVEPGAEPRLMRLERTPDGGARWLEQRWVPPQ